MHCARICSTPLATLHSQVTLARGVYIHHETSRRGVEALRALLQTELS